MQINYSDKTKQFCEINTIEMKRQSNERHGNIFYKHFKLTARLQDAIESKVNSTIAARVSHFN